MHKWKDSSVLELLPLSIPMQSALAGSEPEPELTQGSWKSRTTEGFSFIAGAMLEWLLLPRNFCQPASIATRAEGDNFTAGSREGLTTSTSSNHLINMFMMSHPHSAEEDHGNPVGN